MSRRGRRRRKTRRKLWLWSLCLLALVLAAGFWAVATPVGPGAPRLVTIEEGQSVSDVAAMLKRTKLVRSARALAVAAYVTGKWRGIQPGRHELDPGMTGLEMLDALSRAPRSTWQWLTIPEGFTVRQIAERIEEEGLGETGEFLTAAGRPRGFEADFPLPEDSLEGYLFPDTYRIEDDQGERGTVVQMLRRFDQVVWQGLFEREAERDGRSLREVIILASLVEAEAKQEDERPIIAGVFLNRLARGQRLECDATVQYALGADRKPRLMYEDLEIESDYNTYLHEGLPPGPICNPGEASIRAALEPADVPYLYYVARQDGSHAFSRTFAEHRAAIARIRGGRR
jgi:UPF0755 protein